MCTFAISHRELGALLPEPRRNHLILDHHRDCPAHKSGSSVSGVINTYPVSMQLSDDQNVPDLAARFSPRQVKPREHLQRIRMTSYSKQRSHVTSQNTSKQQTINISISFARAILVISGPSDTRRSFIVQPSAVYLDTWYSYTTIHTFSHVRPQAAENWASRPLCHT